MLERFGVHYLLRFYLFFSFFFIRVFWSLCSATASSRQRNYLLFRCCHRRCVYESIRRFDVIRNILASSHKSKFIACAYLNLCVIGVFFFFFSLNIFENIPEIEIEIEILRNWFNVQRTAAGKLWNLARARRSNDIRRIIKDKTHTKNYSKITLSHTIIVL